MRILLLLLISCGLFSPAAFAQTFPDFEVEPNGASATATPIPSNPAKMRGYIYPNADEDYYSFSANAGDRVYAAVMTSFSANASTDSQLELFDTDGVTSLEFDDDNGSFGATSSSIAGATIPANGTYFLRVKHFSATNQLRPYDLYVQVQSGSPVAEIEPNDVVPAQVLSAGGWVSGSTSSTTDVDFYTISLNAGESVFLSLDLDPERDDVEWNGRIGLGPFAGFILVGNDGGATGPDSEAFFLTAKETGTYSIFVGLPDGGTTFGTYHLSVSKFAAETGYTNYASADVPVVIPTGPALVTSTLTIPDNKRIKDLSVRLDLIHANMPDLDIILESPAGNLVHLLSDIGSNTQTSMNLFLNDHNAIPVNMFTVLNGVGYQPELSAFLNYFKGMNTQGTWTLHIYDDTGGANGGTLNGWSIDILEDTDPDLTGFTAIFDEDFETEDGGFTHSGVQDEWEHGTPAFAPITTANSGTQCWKTDLDNTYNANSNQLLESPDIDLTAATGEIIMSWAMKYQMENATFDQLVITVEEVGGGGMTQTLFTWYGATMTASVGNPTVTLNLSAGWATFYVDISAFAGKTIRFKVRVITDTTVQLSGVAIDDVKVYNKPAGSIIVASAGTGGTISPSGNVNVANGANQMFTITPDACYSIADVLVDGVPVGAVPSYTFFNVTTGHTISASFTAIPLVTYYRDMDNDAFGDPAVTQMTCTGPPAGYVLNNTDCNDSNHLINPGATEICDNIDNNCNGMTDEGLTFITYYTDADNDGYGTGAGQSLCANPGPGFATQAGDCNDSNHLINPGATEICDNIDNNCNGMTDEGLTFITYYTDADNDGFGTGAGQSLCANPGFGFATQAGDCNDNNHLINPGATEICDNIDNNCNGMTDEGLTFITYYTDADNDGFGTGAGQSLCANPGSGFATQAGDCNDNNHLINPAASEICDGIDNNCNGMTDEGVQTTFYRDMDGDGFGNPAVTQLACSAPMGYVANDDDCDDTNGAVKPGATEVCDGIDNNCDGTIDNILSGGGVWQNADVGTANGNATFPPCDAQPNDVFTIQASGFSTSSSDKLHLVSQLLCGNVELIARVTGVNSGGWAGITLRESLMPGSKKVALKTQSNGNIRREIRTVANGAVNNLNYLRPAHSWLRLVRSGSNFVGYTSTDGSTWTFAFSATVSMTGCIYVGLFSESINANVVTTATFDNVQINGGVLPLIQAPQTPVAASNLSLEVYPNPTTGEVNIDLSGYADPVGTVKVFDAYGKLVMQRQLDGSHLFGMKIDRADGVYFLSIEVEGEAPVTKRVVVAH